MPLVGVKRFNTNLRRLAEVTVPKRFGQFVQFLAIGALKDVVTTTPVDFGQARAGWDVGIGSAPPPNTKPAPDKGGGKTIAAGTAQITKAPPFPLIVLQNAVVHAAVLDVGGFVPKDPGPSKDPRKGRHGRILVSGGFSVQAPQGMTKGARRRLRMQVASAARAARRAVPR